MSQESSADRLAALRETFGENGIDAFVVPRSDEYQNEYVAPADERLRFISGFTGTAGFAAITRSEAALFTDGRYTVQAQNQTPDDWEVRHSVEERLEDWLTARLDPGSRVGFDPRLHRAMETASLREALAKCGLSLDAVTPNPIDLIWSDRPHPPSGKVEIYPDDLAGEALEDKHARVVEVLREEGMDGLVISAPDNLAWLLNIRGRDLDMLPVAFALAVVPVEGPIAVHIASAKIEADVAEALEGSGRVRLAEPDALDFAAWQGKALRFDSATASTRLVERAEAAGVEVVLGRDPVQVLKARKNATEIAGTRAAHDRDAVPVTRFLRWFAEERPDDATEWDCAQVLWSFRQGGERYRGPSFDTISATGANAALAHYRTAEESAARIEDGDIYLTDSGGQYLDGTTDITRVTVAGTPTQEMRTRYTQVLKGHVALLRQRFPEGLDGAQLDSIARQPLWQVGVDFDHGTGHGIGHYLSVHEGPQSISRRGAGVPLEEGMVVSIEPGYYKPGAFGIRIENLAVVARVEDPPERAERPMLEFDILTFVPYERALIDAALLTDDEIDWIDGYHEEVRSRLAPALEGADRDFLDRMTAPLGD